MTEMSGDLQLDRLRVLDSCVVSDPLYALGLDGATEGIAPRWEGARAVGRVVTMQFAEGLAPEGQPKIHLVCGPLPPRIPVM